MQSETARSRDRSRFLPIGRIDYIFAPATWKLLEHRVIETDVSDHLPIVAVFQVEP